MPFKVVGWMTMSMMAANDTGRARTDPSGLGGITARMARYRWITHREKSPGRLASKHVAAHANPAGNADPVGPALRGVVTVLKGKQPPTPSAN